MGLKKERDNSTKSQGQSSKSIEHIVAEPLHRKNSASLNITNPPQPLFQNKSYRLATLKKKILRRNRTQLPNEGKEEKKRRYGELLKECNKQLVKKGKKDNSTKSQGQSSKSIEHIVAEPL